MLNFFNVKGIIAPKSPAQPKVMNIARNITTPSIGLLNQIYAIIPTKNAKVIPFIKDIVNSFLITFLASLNSMSPSAKRLTVTVNACEPVFPPREATIGIKTASATNDSIVESKIPIIKDDKNAVIRLKPSQTALDLLAFNAP